jgi:hypothetical protein
MELTSCQSALRPQEQSWALQGGAAALNPSSAMIEDCLLGREVVALPSSSALVFPLVEQGMLLGLLLIELDAAQEQGGASRPMGLESFTAGTADGAAAMLLPALCAESLSNGGVNPAPRAQTLLTGARGVELRAGHSWTPCALAGV